MRLLFHLAIGLCQLLEGLCLLLSYAPIFSYGYDLPHHHQAKHGECRQQQDRANCLLQALCCHYIPYYHDEEPDQRDKLKRTEQMLSQVLLWTPLMAFSSRKRTTASICSKPDGEQPEEPPQVN